MKSLFEGAKHFLARDINYFVKMATDCDFSREMIKKEIENRFFNATISERKLLFESVLQRSYSRAWMVRDHLLQGKAVMQNGAETGCEIDADAVNNSPVMHLAVAISRLAEEHEIPLSSAWKFGDSFFDHCMGMLADDAEFADFGDEELLEIFVRQAAIIVQKSDCIVQDGGTVGFSVNNTNETYIRLFNSFWNRVAWENLFPSIPWAACVLHRDRRILVDLTMRAGSPFRVYDVAADFMVMTGMGEPSNMVLVSYIDFYFFTWLSLFGIIRYRPVNDAQPVTAEVTPHGRAFLRILQNLPVQKNEYQ